MPEIKVIQPFLKMAKSVGKRRDLGDSILLCLLHLVVWSFFLPPQRTFVFRDAFLFFLPSRKFWFDQISQGIIPFWNPFAFCGTPFFANLQNAVFYPPHFLNLLLPFHWGYFLEIVFHFCLAAVGMYQLARHIGLKRQGAFTSAVLFSFAAPLLVTLEYLALFNVLAWMPWCIGRVLVLYENPNGRNALWVALVWAIAFLAGMPEMLVIAAVGTLFFLALKKPELKKGGQIILYFAMALVVFGMLTLFQIWPFLEEVARSTRASADFSNQIFDYAMHPFELWAQAFPLFFGGLTGKWFGQLWLKGTSLGVIAVSLVAVIPWRERLSRVLGLALLFFVLLALGKAVPGMENLLVALPGFSKIRYPAKYFVFVLFLLALLVGKAASALDNPRCQRRWFFVLTILSLANLAVAFFQAPCIQWVYETFPNHSFEIPLINWQQQKPALLLAMTFLLTLNAGLGWFVFREPWRRYLPVAVTLAIALEWMSLVPFFIETVPTDFLMQPSSNIEKVKADGPFQRVLSFGLDAKANQWLQSQTNSRVRYTASKNILEPNFPTIHHVGFAYGYQGLVPKVGEDIMAEAFSAIQTKPSGQGFVEILKEWGVTHLAVSIPIKNSSLQLRTRDPFYLYTVIPKPVFCWVEDDLGKLLTDVACTFSRPNVNQMKVKISNTLATPVRVVLRERYHPNWVAGDSTSKPLSIKPYGKHHMAMAVDLPAGQDGYDVVYRQPHFLPLGILALVTLMAILFVCILGPRAKADLFCDLVKRQK